MLSTSTEILCLDHAMDNCQKCIIGQVALYILIDPRSICVRA